MKKIILFIACIALTAGVNAQVKYGIKAGLNLSSASSGKVKLDGGTYDESAAGDILPSFHIGVYGNRSFNNYLGMQMDPFFPSRVPSVR